MVKNAPTHFGTVDYEILSQVESGKIAAIVKMPSRGAPGGVFLRLRHPKAAPIRSVAVGGKAWTDWDAAREVIRLHGLEGTVRVEAAY